MRGIWRCLMVLGMLLLTAVSADTPARAQIDSLLRSTTLMPTAPKPLYLSSKSPVYDLTPFVRVLADETKDAKFAQMYAQFRAGQGVTPDDVLRVLQGRMGTSGHDEKASRK